MSFPWDEEEAVLADIRPADSPQKGVPFYLVEALGPQPNLGVGVEQPLDEVLALAADLVGLGTHLRPVDAAPEDIVEYGLDGRVREGGSPHDHLVGDNAQGEPVHGLGDRLSLEDLGGDVVGGAVEGVGLFEFFFLDEFAEVEVGEDEVALGVDDDVVLSGEGSTGLRSRWIMSIEWRDSTASTRLARYTLAEDS